MTFPSPWKHARAKEGKTRREITHMANFEGCNRLDSGPGRNSGATRDRRG